MKKSDIKKSVNSQMLTVFFMPLAVSGIHMLFAFRMIELMLNAFGLINPGLFLITTIISFTVFALFYTVVSQGYRKQLLFNCECLTMSERQWRFGVSIDSLDHAL